MISNSFGKVQSKNRFDSFPLMELNLLSRVKPGW